MAPPASTPTMSSNSSALRALLDAESADVVRELLDDGCKAWCDGLRAGPSARATRLAKNAAKSAEMLRVEATCEAEACAEACEAFVRRAVWTLGEGERAGTTTGRGTLGFEPGSGHERLDALLVERALERRHKWREKSAAAAAMPGRFLADFDWAVRAATSASKRTTTKGDEDEDDDHPDAVCRAAARLVVRDAGVATSSIVDLHFDVHPRALRRVAASCAAARRAVQTLAPDADADAREVDATADDALRTPTTTTTA
jgi:hypothetical protein